MATCHGKPALPLAISTVAQSYNAHTINHAYDIPVVAPAAYSAYYNALPISYGPYDHLLSPTFL